MITETINTCISALDKKRLALEKKQSAEDYQLALASLSKACEKLEQTLDALEGISENGIVDHPVFEAGTRDELMNDIDQCGSGLEEGVLSKEMVQVLDSHVKHAKATLSSTWREISAQFSDGVSGYLGIVRGIADNPSEVDKLRESISTLTRGEPSNTAAKKLSAVVKQANTIISQFSLRPEIETFLKKVSSRQATILDLSPDVVSWLRTHNLSEKLKISF